MTSTASLSMVPEAPSVSAHLAHILHSSSAPAPPSSIPALPLSPKQLARYPTLPLRPYSPTLHALPSNVLSFLHNAAKRELCDLVTVVVPALRHHAALSPPRPFPADFQTWWSLLLRFFFFVADTNVEVVALMADPVLKVLAAHADHKALNAVRRKRKSIADRYDFAMEYVFRAADNAVVGLRDPHGAEELGRAAEKLDLMAGFVLDTLQLVADLADQVETIMPELEIGALEYVIPDNLAAFARNDKPVLLYTCARWMGPEHQIKPWVIKFGGLWARIMFKSWQKMHAEQRAVVIDNLSKSLAED